jgi:predicted nucleic acid-binding protein
VTARAVPYVYDAGALIAIDGNDRHMWARHERAVTDDRSIYIPSVVVGQVWRGARRQVLLSKFLAGCHVQPIDIDLAKAAGVLCGRARTTDVVDATVVVMAATLQAIVWTSDPHDLKALADESGVKPGIVLRTV